MHEIEKGKTKISKTKSCFLEEVNKVDKPLARLSKKISKTTPIYKIINKKGDMTATITQIQRIITECHE